MSFLATQFKASQEVQEILSKKKIKQINKILNLQVTLKKQKTKQNHHHQQQQNKQTNKQTTQAVQYQTLPAEVRRSPLKLRSTFFLICSILGLFFLFLCLALYCVLFTLFVKHKTFTPLMDEGNCLVAGDMWGGFILRVSVNKET
uniref:Uncharacterized protein n=1 Tax=Mus musculus TaxID=10090 RepID=Q8CA79_MOUSE|nr:unnamed protein product [Mus musculus]